MEISNKLSNARERERLALILLRCRIIIEFSKETRRRIEQLSSNNPSTRFQGTNLRGKDEKKKKKKRHVALIKSRQGNRAQEARCTKAEESGRESRVAASSRVEMQTWGKTLRFVRARHLVSRSSRALLSHFKELRMERVRPRGSWFSTAVSFHCVSFPFKPIHQLYLHTASTLGLVD